MSKKIWSFLERYLTIKIGVEFKCCISFFCILCFYCVCRFLGGASNASILHMLEMILLAYVLGWIQALVGSDFDEVDRLGRKEWLLILLGSTSYALTAHWGNWFDKRIGIGIGFGIYMVGVYLTTFLMYKMKRAIDAKLLNESLKHFQERSIDHG